MYLYCIFDNQGNNKGVFNSMSEAQNQFKHLSLDSSIWSIKQMFPLDNIIIVRKPRKIHFCKSETDLINQLKICSSPTSKLTNTNYTTHKSQVTCKRCLKILENIY